MKIIINNRTYQLGVYRKFKAKDLHSLCTSDNSSGISYDLDRFGFRETSEDIKTTPGDVSLLFDELPTKPTVEESRLNIQYQKRRIESYQRGLRTDKHNPVVRIMRGELLCSIWHVKDKTPPYNSCILFTMKTGDSPQSEMKKMYIDYTKSLREASKHLNAQIFGRYCCPIQVKKMTIESGETTLRLPPDVKFHVQIIEIDCYISRTIENLSQILTDSSFPLKTIETTYIDDTEDLMHQNILEAKKFVVLRDELWAHDQEDTNWSLFPSRTHFVDCPSLSLSILEHWQVNEPDVGTSFSISCSTSGRTQQKISDEMGGVIEEGIIVVDLNDTRNIEVTFEEVDKNKYDSYGASHILNMKVVGK